MLLPIPENLNPDYQCWVIQWPDDTIWRSFLVGFMSEMAAGRSWDGRTGSIVGAQTVGRAILNRNIPLKESFMACDDIDALVSALNSQSGSCSCGGCSVCDNGSRGAGPTGETENPQEIDDEGGAVPEGFPDWPTYKTYKCNAATQILDQMISDVGLMTGGTFLGLTITEIGLGIAAVILTPIPADDILLLAALILAVLGLALNVFNNAQTLLQDHYDDFICAMYNAPTVASARDSFNAVVVEKADMDYPTQPTNFYIEQLLGLMASSNNFNRLTTADQFTPLPTGDCSSCPDVCLVIWCFDADLEGWSLVDESDPGSFAFGTYNVANQAILVNLQLPAVPNQSAINRASLSIPEDATVTPGDIIQADHLATSDGAQTQLRFEVYYTDATSEIGPNNLFNGAGQIQYVITSSGKRIDRIEMIVSRSTGGAGTPSQSNNFVTQIALNLQSPNECPAEVCPPP